MAEAIAEEGQKVDPEVELMLNPDVRPAALVRAGTDVPQNLSEQESLADQLSRSAMLPSHFVGKPQNVLAVMVASRALDIPLWQALQHLHLVKGKTGMSADLMRSLLLRAGYRVTYPRRDREAATCRIVNPVNQEITEITWTIEEALAAGLVDKIRDDRSVEARSDENKVLPWEAHTASMLTARATTTAARLAAADILLGMGYLPEELDEVPDRAMRFAQPQDAAPGLDTRTAARYLDMIESQVDHAHLRAVWIEIRDAGHLHSLIDGKAVSGWLTERHQAIEAETGEADASAPPPEANEDGVPDEALEGTVIPGPAVTTSLTMTCGCDSDEVFKSGQHQDGCTRRTEAHQPEPTRQSRPRK